MAKPTAPSVGSRILYYGVQKPQPTFYIAQPSGAKIYNPIPDPNAPLDVGLPVAPGHVLSVGGSAPDYIGMVVAVHAPDGSIVTRTGMVNIATWQGAGSDPTKARWDYVDLSA